MEKYKILSTEHSIICQDMIDVELALNEHLVKCFRVSSKLQNVKRGAECVMHDDVHGVPVAYCFGNEMHIARVPDTLYDAHRQISNIAGITRFSLNKLRFYIALRAAMRHCGMRPSMIAATNMMHLARLQRNSQGK